MHCPDIPSMKIESCGSDAINIVSHSAIDKFLEKISTKWSRPPALEDVEQPTRVFPQVSHGLAKTFLVPLRRSQSIIGDKYIIYIYINVPKWVKTANGLMLGKGTSAFFFHFLSKEELVSDQTQGHIHKFCFAFAPQRCLETLNFYCQARIFHWISVAIMCNVQTVFWQVLSLKLYSDFVDEREPMQFAVPQWGVTDCTGQ
jgi:hypothetical protein